MAPSSPAKQAHLSPWKVIPPGILIVAVTYGLSRYTFGLFIPVIRSELELSIATMGAIASASYAGYLIATLVATVASGRIGPKLPVVLGGVCATVGMMIISTTHSSLFLAIGVFIAGMSPGLAYPPLSDAVTRLVQARQRNWTYAIINSGTSLGVIISGPLALFAGADWRVSWLIFTAIAAIATAWNARVLPGGSFQMNQQRALQPITCKWLFNRKSLPLFVSATLFGIATSVIWTFAVDFLTQSGGLTEESVTLFWVLIGVSGIVGAGTAQLFDRFGLRVALGVGQLAVASSLLLLYLFPNSPLPVFTSALLFGSSFIIATALYGIWSMHLFPERPSAGFGWTFFLISIGQFIGPLGGGGIAQLFGGQTLLLIAAGIAVLTIVIKANENELNALASKQAYVR